MSEPWLVDDFYSLSGTGANSNSNMPLPSMFLSTSLSVLVPLNSAEGDPLSTPDLSVPVGIAAWASRKMKSPNAPPMQHTLSSSGFTPHSTSLPQILECDYSAVYNKNGRIGIYTREERQSILSRFQDKRRNRVWKKKIRYHCRKNLADRRVRIKVIHPISSDFNPPLLLSFSTHPLHSSFP
jgi:hypothetical protein